MTDLRSLRHEYAARGLDESELLADPLDMFSRWFDEAVDAGLDEPNAMVLATADPAGVPSARIVLLKGIDGGDLTFFTNQSSRKGAELAANPCCALLFPWHGLERQVRVEGLAVPLSRPEVEDYFAVRPRGSQVGAHASHQSSVVGSRADLESAYAEAEARFEGGAVPPPEEWGGYRVRPEVVEFWQGRPSRLHDRLVYRRSEEGWSTQRLAP